MQKEALMEQVAHQAVVMQFILEMALNSQKDPRGCFRQFFHKAKVRCTLLISGLWTVSTLTHYFNHFKRHHANLKCCAYLQLDLVLFCCFVPNVAVCNVLQEGQDVYLEVFHTELEAFKHRVREYAVNCRVDNNAEQNNTGTNCRLDPKESVDSLPPVSFPLFSSLCYCSLTIQLS